MEFYDEFVVLVGRFFWEFGEFFGDDIECVCFGIDGLEVGVWWFCGVFGYGYLVFDGFLDVWWY